tara:strand:- start:946 stop:2151 length:1206 start_codon:yes stop_codon:yes gene_type:complete
VIVGIIGKPNTGKSTFFNAATLLSVPMADYPFTTIKPNRGVAYLRVPCVCRILGINDNPVNSFCREGSRFIPVNLVDIAGLVPGASSGRGLGNKFLDDVRQADALIHVVDASGSTDEEGGTSSPGSHDPIVDIDFIVREFDLWLQQILTRDWQRISRTVEAGADKLDILLAERLSGLSISGKIITECIDALGLKADRPAGWRDVDILALCSIIRSRSKPTLVAANKADLPLAKENIQRMREKGELVIPCAAEAELLLRRAAEKKIITYLPGDVRFDNVDPGTLSNEQKAALGMVSGKVLEIWGSTGVQETINSAFQKLLGTIVVYPVEDEGKMADKNGNVLPDAYVVRSGSTARDLANVVHSDLGDSFLYAIDVRKGTRLGADHPLKDNDVIKIVSAGRRG